MEENIIYYLFNRNDLNVFEYIYKSYELKSLQDEIFIDCDKPYWYSINNLVDFINSYQVGAFATVNYSVKNNCNITQISFSYMFDGYLLVGFSGKDISKKDMVNIEKKFREIKYLDKRITVEDMPFSNKECFEKAGIRDI